MNETDDLTVEELSRATGVPVRTIRVHITEGLLPGPGTRGRAATYTCNHRRRLALIRQLAEQRVPLREIRGRVAGLSPEVVSEVLAAESERAVELREASATGSPKDHFSLLLDRACSGVRELRSDVSASSRPSLAPSVRGSPLAKRVLAQSPGSDVAQSAGSLVPDVFSPARSWERWELAPGAELHVRVDEARDNAGLIQRLFEATRPVPTPRE